MNPLDVSSGPASGADPRYQVSGVTLDAMRSPLAAILGRAQILERRLLQDVALVPEDALAALAAIERSVWELERQLRSLQQEGGEER